MASAREAFQRQRAVNMGAAQDGLREHVLHGSRAQKFEHDFERERVLLAEREYDAVIGGGGLQFEIEGAAEALAQRQAPGAVDARAEGRVDHQLHAAGFVEEALGDDAAGGGHGAEGGVAGLHIGEAWRAAASAERRNRAGRSPVRAISSRSCETSSESSRVRPGASPRQKGMVGAAPWASSTRTRPASTRRMRQEVVPSRNTSPARLSTAKSSSSVPTVLPSGSATTRYCAVSGMAPPEVMAASRAPRRPRTRRLTASRCS